MYAIHGLGDSYDLTNANRPGAIGLVVAEVGKYGPYRPEAYNSLPTLSVAGTTYETQDAEKILFGPMRQLFLDHNAQDTYGVALLHNHFDLAPEDRLVEQRGISVPWSFGDARSTTAHKWGGIIKPRSLMLYEGQLVPYEFLFQEYHPSIKDAEQPDSRLEDKFLEEFKEFLTVNKLEAVFGLGLLTGHEKDINIEVTEGKANIMLPEGSIKDISLMPAFWKFGPDEDDRCNCFTYCPMIRGKHTGESIHGCG